MDFGDVDDQKGYHILDIEKINLLFYKNTISPKHKKIYLSKFLSEDAVDDIKKQIKNNFIKFIVDCDIPVDTVEEIVRELGNLKPRSLNVDYLINFNKLKFDDGEQDFSSVDIETAIDEFVQLMNIDNKKEIIEYTQELYKKCI